MMTSEALVGIARGRISARRAYMLVLGVHALNLVKIKSSIVNKQQFERVNNDHQTCNSYKNPS